MLPAALLLATSMNSRAGEPSDKGRPTAHGTPPGTSPRTPATTPAAASAAAPVVASVATLPDVIVHDNRRPAGTLKGGQLYLDLRAGRGVWRPQKASGPALEIDAFGERSGALNAPAPLIRVLEGTTIVASIRNDLAFPLRVHGLCEHRVARESEASREAADPACPTIEVPAEAERKIAFRAGRPGTYGYWADTLGSPVSLRFGPDAQLSGAFIVDPAGVAVPEDRVFVITEWTDLSRDQVRTAVTSNDPLMAALMSMKQGTTLLNGLSWPDTERFTYCVGEPVRWRFVNNSPEQHPLHLHGFFFDVDSIGDGLHDTQFAPGQKPRAVTQLVPVGGTVALTWTPERIGNWLFHCHFMEHVSEGRRLKAPGTASAHEAHAGHDDGSAGMGGMVLGITVVGKNGEAVPSLKDTPAEEPRKLTLTMKTAPNRYGKESGFGFVLAEGAPAAMSATTAAAAAPASASTTTAAADDVRAPGPTLVLRRGQPVEITLVNQLPEATAVHWHGMELDSYYDGVHGFGGIGDQRTPLIAPGESFVVRFTPPRTGTFMYHTHMHDYRQLSSGLYGPMLVLDPGETFDEDTDHTIVIGRDGLGPAPPLVLNGSQKPELVWRAGERHRLRIINITRHDIGEVTLRSVDGPVAWRPLTKDGAPVPPNGRAPRRAIQTIAVGETYDFEYEAPPDRKDLWIEVRDVEGRWGLQGRIVVKPEMTAKAR
jgi:FtsP/CotA-like multicopper oxidase with cupredoxin domain